MKLFQALSLVVAVAGFVEGASRGRDLQGRRVPCGRSSLDFSTSNFKQSFVDFRNRQQSDVNFPNPPCGKDPRDGDEGDHECFFYPRDNGAYECEASPTKAVDFVEFAKSTNPQKGTPFFENNNQLCVVKGYKLERLSQWYWQCVKCDGNESNYNVLCN